MPLPNYLIIGETKCGTTSMYDNLIQHPGVLPTINKDTTVKTVDGNILGKKEIRFFDRYWSRGIEWYETCFPKCERGQITGEATPMYLYRAQALQRIASVIPNIKLIVMIRNPVHRLLSHFYHLEKILPDWHNRYPDFETFWNSAFEGDYYIVDKGIYWRSIQMLGEYFPQKNIHIIQSERLFKEPQQVYSETLNFLEVDSFILKEARHSRKNDYTLPDYKLLKEIEMFYEPHNEILQNMIGEDAKWQSF